MNLRLSLLWLTTALWMISGGCAPESDPARSPQRLIPVTLQTDWFAQPEHGGFYQALAKGFYASEGLDVTILSGGPNAMSLQKVLRGRAHFAMNRADFILQKASEGVDIRMIMATLQHDPQALLLHADNPIQSFRELDGKRVMAIPGLSWITYVERKFGIRLNILPHDFGMERFLRDPEFIQQCLLTNEPFYARQHGVAVKVLPLRETGFDPYHGIYCLQSTIADQPELVRRFVRASIRGWEDFATGDPTPALALIAERNPRMNAEFMEFSYRTLVRGGYIRGTGSSPETGQLDSNRLRSMEGELRQLGMINADDSVDWFSLQFLIPVAGDK